MRPETTSLGRAPGTGVRSADLAVRLSWVTARTAGRLCFGYGSVRIVERTTSAINGFLSVDGRAR